MIEPVERKSVVGVEEVVLDFEPVILLLIRESCAELVRKRGS